MAVWPNATGSLLDLYSMELRVFMYGCGWWGQSSQWKVVVGLPGRLLRAEKPEPYVPCAGAGAHLNFQEWPFIYPKSALH